jgi:hypothetical protein
VFEVNGTNVSRLAARTDGKSLRPEVTEPEVGERAAQYAKILKLRLDRVEEAWLVPKPGRVRPELQLAVVNPDGQRADWPFELDEKVVAKLTKASTDDR